MFGVQSKFTKTVSKVISTNRVAHVLYFPKISFGLAPTYSPDAQNIEVRKIIYFEFYC